LSLSGDLRALGECLAPQGLAEAFGFVDPRLKTNYSPRASWPRFKEVREHCGTGRDYSPWFGPEGPQDPEALGSSIAPNSKRPPRYGLKGLPAAGRKQISRALALLEDQRRLLSFWTVTLPTAALLDLRRLGTWPQFQDRVRKELSRKLQAAGLLDLVVGVVELQPKRSHASGLPCPHLHVVFQGRRSTGSGWALSPSDLDAVILAALTTAGVPVPVGIEGEAFLKSAGNVQQVKRSVRAYLSKYMTKGSGDTARWVGGAGQALIPRQWWFWTRPLRQWVLDHVLPLGYEFVAWVHEYRKELEALGLLRFRLLPLSDPAAPLTYEVSWLRCDLLAQVVYLWQTDVWDEEWHRSYRVSQHSLVAG